MVEVIGRSSGRLCGQHLISISVVVKAGALEVCREQETHENSSLVLLDGFGAPIAFD